VEYGSGYIKSPYGEDRFEYDERGEVVREIRDGLVREYEYDAVGKLIGDEGQSERQCIFDDAGLLVQVGDVRYEYVNGQRLSREVAGEKEYYVYLGINELAIVDEEGRLKQLRIPGLSSHKDILRPIAIETRDAVYAPIHDVQGNIMSLVDVRKREVIKLNWADPYGRGLTEDAPTAWIFAGKNYDAEAGVVYFGARFYSPELKRWLTPDPLEQGEDHYQYCFDNPLRYVDPDGRWAIVFPIIEGGQFLAGVAAAATTAVIGWTADKVSHYIDDYRERDREREREAERERFEREKHFRELQRKTVENIDPTLPKNPFHHPDWVDVSHPKAKESGHFDFENKKTGEKIRFDKGNAGKPGHEGKDHYHKYNPDSKNDRDKWLDKHGKPVPKYSEDSHLYPQ